MALYELRTYTLRVGAMAEAVKLYQELGFPALQKGRTRSWSAISRATPARSISLSISGNSMTTPIDGRIGRRCIRTGISSRASRRSSARC
jgi:hypothetical protein